MATKSDELKAQLAVVELEEKLIAAKASKAGPDPKLKMQLREARQKAREARED